MKENKKTPKGRSKIDHSVQDVIPLYYRVYEILRKEIERGDFPENTPLPGEQEIAARFEVSRVTIRRTMLLLEEADLITRFRGRGTFANPAAIKPADSTNYSGFDQNIKDFEESTKVELINSRTTVLPSWATGIIGDIGPVLEIEYTRRESQQPFSHIRVYVPEPEASKLKIEELGNRTVTTALEDAGTTIIHMDQRLTAIAADQAQAKILGLSEGHPLIRVRRVLFDADDRAVQIVEATYNPEFFEYRVELSREKSFGGAPQWVAASK
ncbi:MAG: GntR family transcriptional regulator [Hyphomicrobiales bacterium]